MHHLWRRKVQREKHLQNLYPHRSLSEVSYFTTLRIKVNDPVGVVFSKVSGYFLGHSSDVMKPTLPATWFSEKMGINSRLVSPKPVILGERASRIPNKGPTPSSKLPHQSLGLPPNPAKTGINKMIAGFNVVILYCGRCRSFKSIYIYKP